MNKKQEKKQLEGKTDKLLAAYNDGNHVSMQQVIELIIEYDSFANRVIDENDKLRDMLVDKVLDQQPKI